MNNFADLCFTTYLCVDIHGTQCCRGLENQLISNNRKQIIQRYSTEEADTLDTALDYQGGPPPPGQTVLTPAAKKQAGLETLVLPEPQLVPGPAPAAAAAKLPSIIQCVKEDGSRVEVEPIPRLADLAQTTAADPTQTQAVEIANVQDPETGVTR